MNQRLSTLMAELPGHLDAAIITSGVNRRYYLGLESTAGTLVVTRTDAFLFVDGRYREAAGALESDITILPTEEMGRELPALMARLGVRTAGVESGYVTLSGFEALCARLPGCTLTSDGALQEVILRQRRHKSPEEVALIRKAQHASERAYLNLLDFIRPGRTEKELALELYRLCRQEPDVESAHTDLLLAGPNGSRPHGMAGDRPIRCGEFVTMDFGAVVEGYYADMTRTVAVGEPDDEMRALYQLVLSAKNAATAAIVPGIPCAEVDGAARQVITAGGCGPAFCHGLGHSIGLEGHENPRFREDSRAVVEEGLVMSVEPGVYFPGRLGLRIEDLVYVGPQGVESLNETSTELIVLPGSVKDFSQNGLQTLV